MTLPKPKFSVGDRVIDRETGEAGIVVKMPRDLAREHPQLVVVLFDGTEDGLVYHQADLETARAHRQAAQRVNASALIAERGVNVMLFRKNPEKMTAMERLEYLVRKLGTRFMAPMFKAGFTHFDIAAVLARASGECCPSKGQLEDLYNIMNAGFDQMGNHLAEELLEEAKKKIADEGGRGR